MKLESNSEEVHAMRKTALELLLSDHHATCGSCTSKNTCRLRQHAITYKAHFRRYAVSNDKSRDNTPQAVGKNIVFEQAKCIKCGLCVYNSNDGFTFMGRGFDMQVVPPARDGEWENLVELCPTGAITTIEEKEENRKKEKKNSIGLLLYSIFLFSFFPLLLFSCSDKGSSNTSSSWRHFRADASMSGYTKNALPENPKLLWSYKARTRTVASPVVDNGVVYWGDKQGNIRGVNAAGDSCFLYRYGASMDSNPLIENGVIYTGRNDGRMCALSIADCDTLWTFGTWGQISGAPNLIGNKLVFGSYDNFVYSVDAASGKELARFESGYYINGSVSCWNGYALYGGCDGWLRMVDVTENIEVAAVELKNYIPASTAIWDNMAYVCDFAGNLYEFRLGNGSMTLERTIYEADSEGQSTAMPAVSSNMVCCIDGDGYLRAFNRASGKEMWNTLLVGKPGESSPLICRNKIIVCSKSGQIAILDTATGKLLWEYDAGEQIVGSPAVVKGRFYVLTTRGTLLCFGK
jgi:outer membrane protein assembly factor BamB/ferredoxin